MTGMLTSLYQNQDFVKWLNGNGYTAITADNAARYWSLFTRWQNCQTHTCGGCSGLLPVVKHEHEIQTGLFTQEQCAYLAETVRHQTAIAFTQAFKIPPAFEDLTLVGSPLKEWARDALASYCSVFPAKRNNGLYIHTTSRRAGRTVAAWAVLKELLAQHRLCSAMLYGSNDFAESLIQDSRVDGHPFYHRAMSTELLIIDDFGHEKYTEGYTGRLIAILEHRNWHLKPVIITTVRGFNPSMWNNELDARVFNKIEANTQYLKIDAETLAAGIKPASELDIL